MDRTHFREGAEISKPFLKLDWPSDLGWLKFMTNPSERTREKEKRKEKKIPPIMWAVTTRTVKAVSSKILRKCSLNLSHFYRGSLEFHDHGGSFILIA